MVAAPADQHRLPALVYGTAWKEDETARLVGLALAAGFRGIDTANQRKHYHEAGVGAALKAAFEQGLARRDELFIQTKFTHLGGQDHRLPYDARAPVHRQVEQSFESSLQHLGVDRLDSYVLHGPSVPVGWADEDWQAWKVMEALQRAGRTRLIGVSNVSADQLEELCAQATVKPAVVQNRCFTRPRADEAVRAFCRGHGIAYQGFSLLTGHRSLLRDPDLHAIAHRLGATVPQVVFRHCLERGMVVLTGTTSPRHMAEDLAAPGLQLSMADVTALDAAVG
ncbi:MAG TPA: aldo/keto reductase [Candidatus Thermoplasmatota archaeon]|nr:aldo/keto reductase [Candidatus Thermoplasmatota archaeon]